MVNMTILSKVNLFGQSFDFNQKYFVILVLNSSTYI